jgi:aminomethyltransferase
MLRLPLHDWHSQRARMFEFAGWEMPLQYTGIMEEHLSVREKVGLFDISHMGRLRVRGDLNRLLTRDLSSLREGSARYSCMCNEEGGILDDVVASRLGQEDFFVVVNAATREKDIAWMREHGLEVEDLTFRTFMFALQGPLAERTLGKLCRPLPARRFTMLEAEVGGKKVLVSRTGYTGEDGFELVGPVEGAMEVWLELLEAGQELGLKTCGLGARDTLRLEAGYCLYGVDMDERTTPLEAGLDWTVDFGKDFVGKEGLVRQREEGVKRARACFVSEAIPRHGYELAGRGAGVVTSGTFSPILRRGIGMGYVAPEDSAPGTILRMSVRGREVEARVVKPPFYDPSRYGYTRSGS